MGISETLDGDQEAPHINSTTTIIISTIAIGKCDNKSVSVMELETVCCKVEIKKMRRY